MKTKEQILDFVRKKPMCTVEEITGELHMNHGTIIASLNTLKRKGKVKATDTWPKRYAVPPDKPMKLNNGQGFLEYIEELNRKYEEVKAENNRYLSIPLKQPLWGKADPNGAPQATRTPMPLHSFGVSTPNGYQYISNPFAESPAACRGELHYSIRHCAFSPCRRGMSNVDAFCHSLER